MHMVKHALILLVSAALWQSCGNAPQQQNSQDSTATAATGERSIWTKEQAKTWYAGQPWLVGSNFTPSTAINQLEMWQPETFDTATINRELGWAASLGMNTARVFLHDLLHQQDSAGFLSRMETFLQIADKHKIKPLFVLFDSVWDPYPKAGKQREPKPHVHNSGWIQGPGIPALKDSTQYPRLEAYVKAVVSRFASDERVLGWDIWNEPDNPNVSAYGSVELPDKVKYVLPLLERSFEWARSVNPTQPLTSGVWRGDWTSDSTLTPIEKLQLEQSDVLSYHSYDDTLQFENRIKSLQRYDKPMLCTEFMARGNKNTFAGSLPILKKYNVGAYCWGLVDGKTQTIYAWDSWKKKYTAEPKLWFHDIFRRDGKPYKQDEVDLIRNLTGAKQAI